MTLRCGVHFADYAWFLQPPEWAVLRQGFGRVYCLMGYDVPPHGVVTPASEPGSNYRIQGFILIGKEICLLRDIKCPRHVFISLLQKNCN